MKLGLTSVYVDDPSKAFKFYTEVLGFVERLYVPEAQLAMVVSPEEPGGVGLLLEPNNNPIASTYQSALFQAELPVIVFAVDKLQQEHARLEQLGVVFRKPPTKIDMGTEAIIEDTCGNLIQLYQA